MIAREEFARRLRAMASGGVGPVLPRRAQDRHILLKAVSLGVAPALPCSERALGEALERWLEKVGPRVDIDAVSLRRFLVDLGYLRRDAAGRMYELSSPRSVAFDPEIDLAVAEEILESIRGRP